ncbi:MAG TPA: CoA-binding protein [Candidatus Nitrosocosmicus sp.]|nr:CoA-binding protein [Candidatus Nitrosocosmicus sp.]
MGLQDIDNHTDVQLRAIYDLKNIAVVGMSATEGKPANYVPKYLIKNGYNVVPVNPNYDTILGLKSYPTVSSIPFHIDIVDVFRKSDDVLPVAKDAILKKGLKVFWMQLGIINKEAKEIMEQNGVVVIFNRCMLEEHSRLF